MSFTGTDFGPGLLHQGQLYWDTLMGTKCVNSTQRARDANDVAKHILYTPWFTGSASTTTPPPPEMMFCAMLKLAFLYILFSVAHILKY
jgi:hypothetical protein